MAMTDQEVRRLKLGGVFMKSRFRSSYCDYCNMTIGEGTEMYYMKETDVNMRTRVWKSHARCLDNHVFGARREYRSMYEEWESTFRFGRDRDENRHTTKTSTPTTFEGTLNQLFKELPKSLREKTYKNLARAWHPDTGGDNEIMKTLSRVWEKWS